MSNGFSMGEDLSDFVNETKTAFEYNQLKKSWVKHFIISTAVVGSSILALVNSCNNNSSKYAMMPELRSIDSVYVQQFTTLAESYKNKTISDSEYLAKKDSLKKAYEFKVNALEELYGQKSEK